MTYWKNGSTYPKASLLKQEDPQATQRRLVVMERPARGYDGKPATNQPVFRDIMIMQASSTSRARLRNLVTWLVLEL